MITCQNVYYELSGIAADNDNPALKNRFKDAKYDEAYNFFFVDGIEYMT